MNKRALKKSIAILQKRDLHDTSASLLPSVLRYGS